MIDTKLAVAVKALARVGGFREAAAAAGVSPATLSRRISQAEDYAGKRLFERSRNGTTLTEAGQKFLQLLSDLDTAGNSFERGVAALRDEGASLLAIGCGPLTTRTIISPSLEKLLSEMPDLRVRIDVRATKEPLEALRSGRIDIAVCDLTHTPDLSDLEIQVAHRRPVSFWARPEHPIHAEAPVPLDKLFRRPLMAPFLHKHWRATFAEILGGDAQAWELAERLPQIECDDYGMLIDLACRCDIVCGGMTDAFVEHAKLERLKQVTTQTEIQWNICFARRRNHRFDSLDVLWRILRTEFGV
ncbi:LysR family transcriptional regulator [Ruegeria sp. THAF33]|uniref:LysR family transcriptional regulator n=1 Tax=Ruegeria sp. THAF33 TaxID=2587853 RepID=UPI00126869EE|nr:LysR family transcriptional regulator [Ruegeria sp. THAF33]QFT75634.1 HTH-type transcriptional activator CmpR [Ruegeria sp. THAF33]